MFVHFCAPKQLLAQLMLVLVKGADTENKHCFRFLAYLFCKNRESINMIESQKQPVEDKTLRCVAFS